MTTTEIPTEEMLAAIDLKGMRIGLSGAIPNTDEWARGRAMDWEILNAVSTLADTVFRGGGILVHGSHPSFTPRIIVQAKPYADERGKPVAVFFLSGLYADGLLAQQLRDAEKDGVVDLNIVEPVYPEDRTGLRGTKDPVVRNASLTAMRKALIREIDALVIVGGKRHPNSQKRPGTWEELQLALEKGIAVFPLGGLGGMASELVTRPEYIKGLTPQPFKWPHEFMGVAAQASKKWREENRFITTTDDYGRAIELIAGRLSGMAQRNARELSAD